MKIYIIHRTLSVMGGAEQDILNWTKSLVERGHDVLILTNYYEKDKSFKEFEKYKIKVIKPIEFLPFQLFDLQDFLNGIKIFLYCLRLKKKPDFFFFGSNYSIPIFFKMILRVPIGLYIHFPEKLIYKPKREIKKILYRNIIDKFEYLSYHQSRLLYTNSHYTQDIILKEFNCKTIVNYPFPLPLNFPVPKKKDFVLLSVNRIHPGKKITLALKTFKILTKDFPELRLIIAGFKQDEVYYEKLLKLIDTYKINCKVDFKINLTSQEIFETISHATLLLYTSLYEHLGITPFVAAALKVPAIVTDSGGLPETVEHGKSGLVLPWDPDIWAREISKLLLNPKKIEEMGEYARYRVQHILKWEKQEKRIVNDLDILVKKNKLKYK